MKKIKDKRLKTKRPYFYLFTFIFLLLSFVFIEINKPIRLNLSEIFLEMIL